MEEGRKQSQTESRASLTDIICGTAIGVAIGVGAMMSGNALDRTLLEYYGGGVAMGSVISGGAIYVYSKIGDKE
ncbi:MAG: hypothetical protein KJ879_00970 [Nanoarchaeota archaeon]|nr:hypothetical protein [Nanoarchaeota archaeon]